MGKKYGYLRLAITVLSVLGILGLIGGIAMLLIMPFAFWNGLVTIIAGIVIVAMGQVFQVLLDIEAHARETNDHIKQLTGNLEQYARALLSRMDKPGESHIIDHRA